MATLHLLARLALLALCFSTVSSVKLTYYWFTFERDYPLGSDAILADCSGKQLARTSKRFADEIAVEGSGYLRDGKTVLNLGSCISDKRPCKPQGNKYSCFFVTDAPKGSRGNNLVPFVSTASNSLSYGTTGIMTALKGKRLPSGETHDGCVRIDDTCSTCTEPGHLDFLIFKKSNLDTMNRNVGGSTDFQRTRCTPKRYKY